MPPPDPKRETQPDQAETQVPSTETPTRVKGSESGKVPADFLAALAERYEVLNELGQGGMGVVYRARDLETDEIVALKLLKPEIANNQDLMERFRNELRLARKITHKNVCRTHELLRFGSTYVISMEYVKGDSLRHVLNRFGGLPFKKAIQLAGEVCAGLAEAHSQGVVHRDLKPENVMLDDAGYAKVMDFGIARSFSAEASTAGGVIGTPDYMSPEQAESKSVDARTDVYLLGLLLYEIFTGARAFTGDTPVAVVLKQIKETPAPPSHIEPGIPRHVETVILRCLEKDPQKRFQTIPEIAKALRQERQAAAPKESIEELALPLRLARWQKSDWVLLGAAVVSFALFIGFHDRVFPYGEMKTMVTREQIVQRVQALGTKYAPEFQGAATKAVYHPGYAGAFPSQWYVTLERPKGLAQADREINFVGSMSFTAKGEVISIHRNARASFNAPQDKPLTIEEALPQGLEFAKGIFQVVLTDPPRRIEYDAKTSKWRYTDSRANMFPQTTWEGTATPLNWDLPREQSQSRQFLTMRINSGKILYAYRGTAYGDGRKLQLEWFERMDTQEQFLTIGGLFVLLLPLSCLALFFVLKLHKQNFIPVWVFSACVAASLMLMIVKRIIASDFSVELGLPLALMLVSVVVLGLAYLVLAVPFDYLKRTLPIQAYTVKSLYSMGMGMQYSGLSIVRGLLVGLGCILIETILVAILQQSKVVNSGLWNDYFREVVYYQAEPNFAWPLPMLLLPTITVGMLLLALPLSLLQRFAAGRWKVLLLTSLLWALVAPVLLGTSALSIPAVLLLGAIQGLVFSEVFVRYDLLTAMAAIFTFEAWMLTYPVYVIFGATGSWVYASGIIIWATVAVLAFLLWWMPEILGFGRRVKLALQ